MSKFGRNIFDQSGQKVQRGWLTRPKVMLGVFLLFCLLLPGLLPAAPLTPIASAAGGDFSVDFAAAAPFSYTHTTGGGAWNDGTNAEDGDIREELEGGNYACGDTVTFLTEIVVASSPSAVNQTIQLSYSFLADTTGQSGIAITDVTYVAVNYGQVENGDDGTPPGGGPGTFGLDSGISDDGGSTATIISEGFNGNPPFTAGSEYLLTVEIDDFEAGEVIILRIDTFLECQPGSGPTGNLQAKYESGFVVEEDGVPVDPPDAIGSGAQTIPFKQVGQVLGVGEPLVTLYKTVMPQGGTCGVDDQEQIQAGSGDLVTYCYKVTNTGTDPLLNVELTDDNGTPGDPSDDPDPPLTLAPLTDEDEDGQEDDLAAGGTAYAQQTVVVSYDVECAFINTGTAADFASAGTPPDPEPNPYIDTDTASVYLCADYGDHPADYLVDYLQGGPNHWIYADVDADGYPDSQLGSAAIWLGLNVDEEPDGFNSPDSDDDDTTGIDDEDGVTPVNPASWSIGAGGGTIDVLLNSSSTAENNACLVVWFDWNLDDDFTDLGERVISQVVPWQNATVNTPVTQTFNFDIPAPFGVNDYRYRVRLFDIATEGECDSTVPDGGPNMRNGEVEDHVIRGADLPVSITYVEVARSGGNVRFDWSTARETGNLGFNFYAVTDAGRVKLNEALVPSSAIDADSRLDYALELPDAAGAEGYAIESVDVLGRTESFGPFKEGQVAGQRLQADLLNWQAIRAEHEFKLAARQAEAKALAVEQVAEAQAGQRLAILDTLLSNSAPSRFMQASPKNFPAFDLKVDKTGVYRVTYEALRSAGLDLAGVSKNSISLTNRGEPVPIYVNSRARFGPGAYIEFLGQAEESLYTKTNVYQLAVDRAAAERVAVDYSNPGDAASAPEFYIERHTVDESLQYADYVPTGDPWINKRIYLGPKSESFTFDGIDHYVSGAAPVSVDVTLVGGRDWPHTVKASLNNDLVGQAVFNGIAMAEISGSVADGVLKNGQNTLTIQLLTNQDLIIYDKHTVNYPRAFVARDGSLMFTAAADTFVVEGLTSKSVVVYQVNGDSMKRVNPANISVSAQAGGYTARFAGSGQEATYWVVSQNALLQPAISPSRAYVNISSPKVNTLVISHPDFLGAELDKLVKMRQDMGVSVKTVNVEDIYAQYSGGVFDAQAIADYLAVMQPQMVVLVGADTYDYMDYLGYGSLSFMPSLYTKTDQLITTAPVDPLYTDYDGDLIPDAAIGRLPVRDAQGLKNLVAKSLTFAAKAGYSRTAMLASGPGYSEIGDAMAAQMPPGWSVGEADAGQDGVAAARADLLEALNQGVALASYFGHTYENGWGFGFNNTLMFTSNDAAALQNNGRPLMVTQWGCWTTYYVHPKENTMAHKFLLSGDNGAAVVTGATALSSAYSEKELGERMMPLLVKPGTTVGEAMQLAKEDLAKTNPEMRDVLLGWTILGAPWLQAD